MPLKGNEHLLPELIKNLVSRLDTANVNTNEFGMAVAQLQVIREYIDLELTKRNVK